MRAGPGRGLPWGTRRARSHTSKAATLPWASRSRALAEIVSSNKVSAAAYFPDKPPELIGGRLLGTSTGVRLPSGTIPSSSESAEEDAVEDSDSKLDSTEGVGLGLRFSTLWLSSLFRGRDIW